MILTTTTTTTTTTKKKTDHEENLCKCDAPYLSEKNASKETMVFQYDKEIIHNK
jgi:hypothetical protein